MRTATLAILMLGMLASPAAATSPKPPPKYYLGTLQVTNSYGDGVVIRANGLPAEGVTLEPGSSYKFTFPLPKGTETTAALTVERADSAAANATVECRVREGNTTKVRVEADPNGSGGIILKIVGKPGVAHLARGAEVLVASTGGLMPLLLLSAAFGCVPKRTRRE